MFCVALAWICHLCIHCMYVCFAFHNRFSVLSICLPHLRSCVLKSLLQCIFTKALRSSGSFRLCLSILHHTLCFCCFWDTWIASDYGWICMDKEGSCALQQYVLCWTSSFSHCHFPFGEVYHQKVSESTFSLSLSLSLFLFISPFLPLNKQSLLESVEFGLLTYVSELMSGLCWWFPCFSLHLDTLLSCQWQAIHRKLLCQVSFIVCGSPG